jgi:hydroxymethylglutaryl-CoA reductase
MHATLPRLLDKATLGAYLAPLDSLQATTPPVFGTMSPHAMLEHMAVMFRLSLGKERGADQSNILTRTRLVFWFVVDVMPWPKGKLKAPDYFTPPPQGDFDEAREHLKSLLREFVDALSADPARREPTPLFGPITMAQWSRLHGRHLRHHYAQFSLA